MMKIKHLESKSLSVILFIIIFLMYSIVYMTKNMFSSAMATIVEEGIMTKSQTGAISGMFWLVYAIFQVFGGFAADKYSPAKLISIGIAGSIVSNIIIYLYPTYPVIMGAWIFNAIIQFGIWPGIFKIVSTELKESFRSTGMFWILFPTSVGLALSMLVASYVTNWLDNFFVAIISLTFSLVLWIVSYGLISRKMVTEGILKTHTKKQEHPKQIASMKFVIFGTGLISIIIVSFMRTMVDNGIKMMTPVMLMESYANMPGAIATRMSVILVVFSTLGVFITGLVRKWITTNEVTGTLGMLAISIPALILSFFVGKIHYLAVLAGLSIAVAFVHSAAPMTGSFAAMRFNIYGRGGTVSGIINATAAIGNVVASYVFAKIAEFAPWSSVVLIWIIGLAVSVGLCLAVVSLWNKFIKGGPNNEN